MQGRGAGRVPRKGVASRDLKDKPESSRKGASARAQKRGGYGASRPKVVQSLNSIWGEQVERSHAFCEGLYTYLFDSPSMLENTDSPRGGQGR